MKQFIASVIMFLMAGGLIIAASECERESVSFAAAFVAVGFVIMAFIALGMYVFG